MGNLSFGRNELTPGAGTSGGLDLSGLISSLVSPKAAEKPAEKPAEGIEKVRNTYEGFTAPWYAQFKPPTPVEQNQPRYLVANTTPRRRAQMGLGPSRNSAFGSPANRMGMF